MSRALCSFTVQHRGIRLRVRVLGTLEEVTRAYRRAPGKTQPHVRGTYIGSFFRFMPSSAKHWGAITLYPTPKLFEYVPHEVSHAVLHFIDQPVSTDDDALDEVHAKAVGILCAKIFSKVMAYAVCK